MTSFFSCDDSKFKNEVFAKKPVINHLRIGNKVKWYLLMGTENFWKPITSQKWDIDSILSRLKSENQLQNLADDIYHNLILSQDKNNKRDTTFILARGEGI